MIIKSTLNSSSEPKVLHKLTWRKREIALQLVNVVIKAVRDKMTREKLPAIEEDFAVWIAKADIWASLETMPERIIETIDPSNTRVWKSRELIEHAITRIMWFAQERKTA